MAEWFIALALKANILKNIIGSNPILSIEYFIISPDVNFNTNFSFIRFY